MSKVETMTYKDGLPNMPYRPSRRQVIAGMASAGLLTGSRSALAQAPKRVQIPDGEFSPLPIAIPNFVAGTPADAEVGVGVSQVITNNLKRSGLFAPIDPARVPKLDTANGKADWRRQTPYRLYTKRLVHWVWVSTSSMMFRRSLIDLVFPADDQVFRLHMDFYVVVMAQMVAGSLLIDEPLYSYRLHGRNGAADNPVLGGRLHLSARNWGNTYAQMLDRMLQAMVIDRERFVTALGQKQYDRMLLRMRAARANPLIAWIFILRSWLI